MSYHFLKVLMVFVLVTFTACQDISQPNESGQGDTNDQKGTEHNISPAPKGNGSGYGIIQVTRNFKIQQDTQLYFDMREGASGEITIEKQPINGTLILTDNEKGTYIPKDGFAGIDTFNYEIKNDAEKQITKVSGFVDVSPCLRVPTLRPTAANTHVVSFHEAAKTGLSTFMGGNRKGEILVKVSKTESPVTLILVSAEPVQWRIASEQGAQIEKIIVHSMHLANTNVVGAPGTTPIVKPMVSSAYGIAWEPLLDQDFGTMISDFRKYLGQNETAFQGCHKGVEATVPYSADSLTRLCGEGFTPSRYQFDNQKCDNKCGDPLTAPTVWDSLHSSDVWYDQNVLRFSADFLSVRNIGGEWDATVGTNNGRICGKYYFEIGVQRTRNDVWEAIGAGFKHSSGYHVTPYSSLEFFNGGDVVGVALDLDAGQIWYSRNGVFDPSMEEDGKYSLNLWTYDPVHPVVSLKGGTLMKGNFGDRAFKYPVPTGYTPGIK